MCFCRHLLTARVFLLRIPRLNNTKPLKFILNLAFKLYEIPLSITTVTENAAPITDKYITNKQFNRGAQDALLKAADGQDFGV